MGGQHMYRVLKRDGSTVEFDISKISAAMIKAFEALEKTYHPSVINLLALQVASDFEKKIKDGKYIAYFQSFTNTYGDINYLERVFLTAIITL